MPTLQQKIISVAKAEIGTHEAKVNGHWNNDVKYASQVPGLEWANFQPWCATFVSWVALQAGAANLYPSTASCDLGGAWFKKLGRWSDYPAIGAQVFFGTARDLNHTGIVIDYDGDTITTVEGNTNTSGAREGDGVYKRVRLRRSANVIGYGYPAFPGGIKSADPAWADGFKPGTKPPVVKKPAPAAGQAARIDGIDLSHHNTGVTLSGLKKAKAAGVRFVSHKVTEGDGFTDSQYATRRRLVGQVPGLLFGGYHFARPASSSGRAQARQFLGVAKPKVGDFLPALDLEDDGGRSPAELDAWVADFVAEVNHQLGTSDGLIYTKFPLKSTHGWRLWVPRYSDAMKLPVIPAPWDGFEIWQFSDGVFGHPDTVPGIGHCDINTLASKPGDPFTGLQIKAPQGPPVVVKKPAPQPTPARASYRRLQVNVQQTDPAGQVLAHIEECADPTDPALAPDVIVWNELGTLELQQAVHNLAGFDTYMPQPLDKVRSQNAIAISWRRDRFKMVGPGETEILHSGFAGMTPTRVLHTVLLEDLTGGVHPHYEQGTQTVHHVEVAGKPRIRGALTGQNARAKASFAKIAASITAHHASLFGSGDLNVDYLAEKNLPPSQRTTWFPMTVLGAVARIYQPNHHGGTHGGRLIDWGWVTGSLSVGDVKVLPHGSSDHNPVLWTVEQL